MSTDQDLFPADLALKFYASSAGKSYCPANGTEANLWMDRWCGKCAKDSQKSPCQILGWVIVCEKNDSGYPKELQYSSKGQPICTAFERRLKT